MEKVPIQSIFTDRGWSHSDAKTDLNHMAGYLAIDIDRFGNYSNRLYRELHLLVYPHIFE